MADDDREQDKKLHNSKKKLHNRSAESSANDEADAVDDIIKSVAEPLANRHRLLILKALAGATQTFSSLSQLTKLRGGSLLFHLSKKTESGLILQRSERGDYMITARGYGILKGIAAIYVHSNK